ncbi:DNA-directed RNA polymerase I and III 14 KDA polypeptide [Aureobasidium sp. EXF-12298]|nr:DNA-directed RNA polymerase I and III 14 KDA polypeptide [Aureobasidium sp. EXF-12298]KAI4772465.1 DNA-directed RNA polymerase I and III 14 KDA polypeptide [Aureobasidium sp. EXF-3400]
MSTNGNHEMADAVVGAEVDAADVELTEPQRIRVLPGSTDTAASFEFTKEDHTLGNALRYIIMKNPDVEFCGYSIPHPSEAKMNLRIQTWGMDGPDYDEMQITDYFTDEVNVYDVLEKGLNDLMDLCDVVVDKFTVSRDAFNASKAA